MCTCTSCKATDALAGWIPRKHQGERRKPDPANGGFDRWPKGEPAGPRASAAAYAAHVSHGRSGIAQGWEFKPGAAPVYPWWCRPAPHLPKPSRLVADFIAAGYKKAAPSRPEAARPTQPGKAGPHFPALDRQRGAVASLQSSYRVEYSANDTEDGMALKYMTVARAAESWDIAESRVRQWLTDGRIKGAQKIGGIWLIPDKAERPKAAKPGELQAAKAMR